MCVRYTYKMINFILRLNTFVYDENGTLNFCRPSQITCVVIDHNKRKNIPLNLVNRKVLGFTLIKFKIYGV